MQQHGHQARVLQDIGKIAGVIGMTVIHAMLVAISSLCLRGRWPEGPEGA
jgi:hypothetical protein